MSIQEQGLVLWRTYQQMELVCQSSMSYPSRAHAVSLMRHWGLSSRSALHHRYAFSLPKRSDTTSLLGLFTEAITGSN